MKYLYYVNGKGIARYYTLSDGAGKFEIGAIFEKEKGSCVQHNMFVIYSARISSDKELRDKEKELKKKYGEFEKILVEH